MPVTTPESVRRHDEAALREEIDQPARESGEISTEVTQQVAAMPPSTHVVVQLPPIPQGEVVEADFAQPRSLSDLVALRRKVAAKLPRGVVDVDLPSDL